MKSLNKNVIFTLFLALMTIIACKKEQTISDIDVLRNGNNEDVYSTTKLDSAQAIASITQQKLQELYDISALYSSGNKNTAIDSLNYEQIQGYFVKKDSANVMGLLKELDKIISNNALIYQVFDNETYGVETLDKQKYIGLVTTPTTSLKNFKMIETKVSPETKKIILIKFKIQPDEITK